MKSRLKRICIAAAIVIFLGINAAAYRQAYAMMHFTRGGVRTEKPEQLSMLQKIEALIVGINIPKPSGPGADADLSPDTSRVSIHCPDGPTLAGLYSPRPDANTLVVLFHGYAANKFVVLPEAKAFQELGYAVLLMDFRGSGDSSEAYTTIGYREATDVAATVQYAKDKMPYSHIILFGQSMGSASILRAIACQKVKPDGIIIEGVFDKLLNTVRNRCRTMGIPPSPCSELLVFWGGNQFGFDGFAHNPVEYAASVSCPALVMHGENDPRARLNEAHAVFDAMRGPKQFKEFPAVGHESYVASYPSEWRVTVSHFLAGI